MNHTKVHSQGKVPFSWENQPGVCKETSQSQVFEQDYSLQKLPPPPCRSESAKISLHDIGIPLPPCVFQPPLKTCSRTSLKKTDYDPFLAAYKECTKKGKKHGGGFKCFSFFSCKISLHDIGIPLPPCVFQPPLRTCSRPSLKKTDDDPFLAAYKECTKKGKKHGGGFKCFSVFSCKRSCSVRDDNIVRVSHFPLHQRDTDY